MSRKLHLGKRGFTLVELLIVIIIIAVLAAVAIPKFANSGTRSKESALRAELRQMRNAVELFRNDTGAFPNALADLAATTAPAQGKNSDGTNRAITAADFKGPYISAISKDPTNGLDFDYSVASGSVGRVRSANTNTSSDGTAYNTW
jgi:type II secretion system protein G